MKIASALSVRAGGVLLGLAAVLPLNAQHTTGTAAFPPQTDPAPLEARAAKGYWDLHTDHKKLSTTVRFYDGSHRLIHQEDFPGQYIKLTRRHTRVFDQVLNRLLAHSPVHALVTPTPFPERTRPGFSRPPTVAPTNANAAPTFAAVPMQDDKVKVIVSNPGGEKVTVRLEDQTGNVLMHNVSTLAGYQRNLILSQLKAGVYRLTIRGRHKQYVRALLVRHVPAKASVQLLEDVIQEDVIQ